MLNFLIRDEGKVSRRRVMECCCINGTNYRNSIEQLIEEGYLGCYDTVRSGQTAYYKTNKLLQLA